MKMKIIAGMSLLALAAAANAQSSVTLYGRIDNGLVFKSGLPEGSGAKTAGMTVGAQSGGYGESWWGMQGSEDIGGGTKAIFQLESGLGTQSGGLQNGALFGRHATVGLSNANYGTFKLGNIGAGFITQDSWDLDPQVMQQYNIATLDRGRVWAQAGNGFEYTSPSLAGLTVKGQYNVTGVPGNWNGAGTGSGTGPSNLGNAQGRSDGAKVMYNNGPLELLGIYDEIRDGNGQFDDVYVASRELIAGGTYQLGNTKLYVGYQRLMAPDATYGSMYSAPVGGNAYMPNGGAAPTVVNHEWIGADMQVNPALGLAAGIYHANANNGNGSANLFTLAGTYNLSKRTFLYTELGYITNSKTSNVSLSNGYGDQFGPNTVDAINGGGTAANGNSGGIGYGKSQFGAIVGLFHNF